MVVSDMEAQLVRARALAKEGEKAPAIGQYMMVYSDARAAFFALGKADRDTPTSFELERLMHEATWGVYGLCGIRRTGPRGNGGAGHLRKKKSKKNPTHPKRRSSAMRRLLRGT